MITIDEQKLDKQLLTEAVADNGLANQIASRYGQEGKEAIEAYRIVLAIACGETGKITQEDINWANGLLDKTSGTRKYLNIGY